MGLSSYEEICSKVGNGKFIIDDLIDKYLPADNSDEIRESKIKSLTSKFIELARLVYFNNDERGKIKNEINKKFGSKIVEIKSYKKY